MCFIVYTVFSLQDKSSDFSHGTSVGVKNTLFAEQLLGIYEVMGHGMYPSH